MKNRVIIRSENKMLKFYLKNDKGETWLFDQKCTYDVYDWFKNGRSEREVLNFKKWKQNKKLDETINRIPREIRYVSKYILNQERAA